MPIAAAIAGVVGAGASLAGSLTASHDQANAAKNALAYQQQIRSDVQPYLQAGTSALGNISDPNKLAANFVQSPGYQWALTQGQNSVLQNKAMNGLLRSGGAMKSLDAYTTGAASQDFNNWWSQQYDIANLGQTAEGKAAGVADNSSNIAMNAGANAGNAAIGMGNQIGNLAGSLAGLFNPQQTAGGGSSYGGGNSGIDLGFGGGMPATPTVNTNPFTYPSGG